MVAEYWVAILKRRWPLIAGTFLLVIVTSGILAYGEYKDRNWVSSGQLFVSALPVGTAGASAGSQAPNYEAEAGQIAADLAQVLPSRAVATDISANGPVRSLHLSPSSIAAAISASVAGRAVTVTATATSETQANAIVSGAEFAAVALRARYLGAAEAGRSFVRVISPPAATRSSARRIALNFALRAILGLVVALALGLAWDYLDDSIQTPGDLERWLGAPVLGRVS